MTMPLAMSGEAQAQPGGLDGGLGTAGNRSAGLGRYRLDLGPGVRTGGGTVTPAASTRVRDRIANGGLPSRRGAGVRRG
jgi:hypothetical protein